jgi:hypothetical protein
MDMKQTSPAEGGRDAATRQVDARIQEICDQLHRLEALISRTVALPPPAARNSPAPFVFFRPPFE